MKRKKKKRILLILVATTIMTVLVFVGEQIGKHNVNKVIRNSHGKGEKTEELEVLIEGQREDIQIEVSEQEYTHEETQELFKTILKELDAIVLGENQSFDYVDKDLQLITQSEKYPVQIQWQLSSYEALAIDGSIREENLSEEGSLVEIQGTITYRGEQAIYVRNVRVYPPIKEERDKLIFKIRQKVAELEEGSRQQTSFSLPNEVEGESVKWIRKEQSRWYYIPMIGIGVVMILVYREREQKKRKELQRKRELQRTYPNLVNQFAMMFATGATIRTVWDRVLLNQETAGVLYEEMKKAFNEMQSGVPEAEAYELFGRRCGLTSYMKFGAILSQNLRKGSKGICEVLRMEAIEAFERRKSRAKRIGEEAGAKLLGPMVGMLVVVLIMVMVPAFMTMQI